jgi:hypothetical protein
MSFPAPAPAPAPAPSPSVTTNIQFEDITSVSVHCTWTNGAGDNRIVVVSEKDNITVPEDSTEWDANAKYRDVVFSYDLEQVTTPVSWVVYKGNAEEVTVFNLKKQTKYYFYFFEYDIVNGENVYMSDFAMASVTTAGEQPTSNIRIKVVDNVSRLPIEDADVTLTNRKQHNINKGRSDSNGFYTSTPLPTGGIFVTVTAPGYNGVSLRSVFVKNMKDNKSSYKTNETMEYEIRLISM